MGKALSAALVMAAGLGLTGTSMAQAPSMIPDTVDGHVLAAQKAAGLDFSGTLNVLCVQPSDGSDPTAAMMRAVAAGKPRPIPPRHHCPRRRTPVPSPPRFPVSPRHPTAER